MRYASVCSGIEAASVAWEPLGWKPAWFSEIEKFPCAVLAHRFASVPNLGDMTAITEGTLEHHGSIDLLVGGTPCQSFSVAGLRKGLDDPRGNLALRFLQLAGVLRPRWLVWENVPGVRSSGKGEDFHAFLRGLAQLGYGFFYRSFDAQYFNLAQRRERVFVVGHLGDWRRACAVLLERESMSGNPAPSREAGKGFANRIAPCIDASYGRLQGCSGQDALHGHGHLIAHSLRAEGFDASEDRTGRGTPLVPTWMPHADISPAIKARDGKGVSSDGDGDGDGAILVPVAFAFSGQMSNPQVDVNLSQTLQRKNPQAVAFGISSDCIDCSGEGTSGTAGERSGLGVQAELSHTIKATRSNAVAYQMAVRRLTPTECERLQGFPDNWTRIPWRGKPPEQCPDGPRYKAIGNSMAVPCMAWIGRRIEMVDAIT